MITAREYRRFSEPDWLNVRVRSLVEIRNGYGSLPAGTEYIITRKYRGFELQSEPCPCCGIKVFVNRVSPNSLERIK